MTTEALPLEERRLDQRGRRPGRRRSDLPALAVVIPALNEAPTIGSVIAAVPREVAGIREVLVILVDDGSTDATQDEARAAGVDVIVAHTQRRGLVAAFKLGMSEALRRGADVVVNLDGDGQHDPHFVPGLVAPIIAGDADIVLGVRPLSEAREAISPVRRHGNRMGSWLAGKALGIEVSDATSGYRAFGREALLRMNLVSENTYTLETLVHASRQRLRVAEVPVPARPRLVGESRMTHSIGRYITRTASQALRSLLHHHLPRALVVAGLVAALVTTACSLRFVLGYQADGAGRHLPSLLAALLTGMLAVGLFISALIADGIGTSRRLLEDALYHLKRLDYDAATTPGAGSDGDLRP
jgi:hypothetical protein